MSNVKICRLPQVIDRTGLSRSAVYDLISKDKFPSQINLGPRSVGWIENEITAWIDDRIEESRRHESLTAQSG
ncbi:MAG: AlpA family transcriptional regulator [Proteobacteria bacterium]|nr:AlpA family transcriptional regulator [Pseudomonadota bacterium]